MAETTTTSTSTTTTTTTTTVPPEQIAVDVLCAALEQPGLATRQEAAEEFRQSVGEFDVVATADDLAAERCAEDWDRVVAADAIVQRGVALGETEDAITLENLACGADHGFSVDATNVTAETLGLYVVFSVKRDGDLTASSPDPLILDALGPGETQPVSAPRLSSWPQNLTSCSADVHAFLVDASTADAGLAEATHPEVTGDDPAQWFPHLIRIEADSLGARNASDSGLTEDVRSLSYSRIESDFLDPSQVETGPRDTVSVCADSIQQREGLVAFVYRIVTPEHTADDGSTIESMDRTAVGVFRRGSDGQWRWLGASVALKSERYADCGPGVDTGTL